MDVRNVQGVADGTATILTDIITTEVAQLDRFDVIGKSDIAAMIGFQKQKQLLGCSEDSNCIAEIGGSLGVEYVLTGQVGRLGSKYRISLLLVEARKAKVVSRAAGTCNANDDELPDKAHETVTALFKPILAGFKAAEAKRTEETRLEEKKAAEEKAKADAEKKRAAEAKLAAVAPAKETPAPAKPEEGGGSNGQRLAAYGLWGGAVALVGGGVYFGLTARSRYQDLKALHDDPSVSAAQYAQQFPQRDSDIHSAALTADILYGAGLVAGGVGTWLFVRSGKAEGGLALSPVVAPGTLGVVAQGRF